jgi:hypothetical protein
MVGIVAFVDEQTGSKFLCHAACAGDLIGTEVKLNIRPLRITDRPCACGKVVHEEISAARNELAFWCDYRELTIDVFHLSCARELVGTRGASPDSRTIAVAPFAARFREQYHVALLANGEGGTEIDGIPVQVTLHLAGTHGSSHERISALIGLLESSQRVVRHCLGLSLSSMSIPSSDKTTKRMAPPSGRRRTRRQIDQMEEWHRRGGIQERSTEWPDMHPFVTHVDPKSIAVGLVYTSSHPAPIAPSIWSASQLVPFVLADQ